MNTRFLLATAALLSALALPAYAQSTWNVTRVGPGVAPVDQPGLAPSQGPVINTIGHVDLLNNKPKADKPNTGLQPIDGPQPFVPKITKTLPPQPETPGTAPNTVPGKNMQPDTPVQPGTLQVTSVNGVPVKPPTPGTLPGTAGSANINQLQTSLVHVQQEIAQKQAAGVTVPASQLSYEQSLESQLRNMKAGSQ